MTRFRVFPALHVAAWLGVFVAGNGSDVRADDVADIVITEVMYNSATGDREEEFIELHNIGTQAYNLQNFSFSSGLIFTFPSVVLAPGAYLVVCANQSRIQQLYGITNTVGDWDPSTALRNGGERIKLLNATGIEVEDFAFDDRNPWPVLADGYGYSLERRSPFYDNDSPANWSACKEAADWTKFSVTGLATSSTLYIYLNAAGTAYVDDVKLYPTGNPGNNRVQLGDFESTSVSPWERNGNHSGSVTTTEKARGGSRSLKIVATGGGTGSQNGMVQTGLGLTNGQSYTLEFYYSGPSGLGLIARLSQTGGAEEPIYVEARGGGSATPGRVNSVYGTDIPPFIYPGQHSPAKPVAATVVTLQATVQDDASVASVTAHWDSGTGEQTGAMFDDGAHGDGLAGDGLYGISIGSYATNKIVRYWFTATDSASQDGRFPFAGNPTQALGFYIEPNGINPAFQARSNTGLTATKPPVYHLIIDPAYLDANGHLENPVDVYKPGIFVYNGEVFDNIRVRHRGQSSLGRPKKHWKVDFNKDHRFRTPFADHDEVDNINIQSSEGDKSFLREWLEYKAMMDAGLQNTPGVRGPALEAWHVRMYLNGAYRGLYVSLENPDEDWMDRVGLDAEGWLWKSYSEAKGGTGGFEMEEDAGNPSAANAALGTFISNMNTLTGQNLVNYINANMDVATFIDFLAVHQLTHDADHPAKNYLVYADEDSPAGTWTYLLWDADLSHGRNFECSNCGLGGGVWNDCIRWDFWGDPQLLFGTSSRPKCDGPWNGVINAFLLKTTTFRQPFYERVSELLADLYHPDVLNPIIDDMSGPLVPEVALDWARNPPTYGVRNSPSDYTFHVGELKRFVTNRYGYLANALTNLNAPDLDGLICERVGNDASLRWTNHGTYQSIKVYRNSTLQRTLSGTATSTTVPLDLGTTINSFRVASVFGGVERPGQSCTIIISSGGYTKVIDEDFTPNPSASDLAVTCNAAVLSGALQLTEPVGNQAGTAFFLSPFPDGDFIADFDFILSDPSSPGADGMVFFLNTGSTTDACGAAGGGLGYFTGDAGPAAFPGYAVALDTWQNEGEPSHNWAGFFDSDDGRTPGAAVDVPEEFTGNGTFHAKVIGKAGTFSLFLSNAGIGMTEREIFTYTVPGFVEQDVYFGFSAGTGGAVARHIVDNFVLQINTGSQPVTAAFSGSPRSGAPPLSVKFTNTSTGATSYLWNFGDGTTSSDVSPTHVYDEDGTYSVTLTATGPGGQDTQTETDHITVVQPVVAAFVASPALGDAPLSVTFTNQSTGATSYLWDFGDGSTSTVRSPAHSYGAGQFTVTLTARGSGGAEDVETKPSYIQVDGPLDANFSASPTAGAAPLTVEFTDTSIANTITSWLWNFGDGTTSSAQHPSHTYTADGKYTVRLQIFGFANTSTETKAAFIKVGGTSEPVFIRGDANNDGDVDISDPISILNYLFLGGIVLDCLDAGDVDDSGLLNITDPINLLGFLFQGGGRPAAPFPDAGPDPTPGDSLAACTRGI